MTFVSCLSTSGFENKQLTKCREKQRKNAVLNWFAIALVLILLSAVSYNMELPLDLHHISLNFTKECTYERKRRYQ
jgi:hypothetical protein